MMISEKDLAGILKQPGYSVDTECPQSAQDGLQQTFQDERANHYQNACSVESGASYAVKVSEWEFQSAVFAEARRRAVSNPAYSMLVAIPNGQYRKGQRPEAGLTPGLPDLALFVPRGGHGALFIELKVGRNKWSAAQMRMMAALERQGYRCAVVWDSVDKVYELIEEYLHETHNQ